jgi:hypothetical protein
MNDLGLEIDAIAKWFIDTQNPRFALIRVDPEVVAGWPASLATALRRCYITDTILQTSMVQGGLSAEEIIGSKLPNAGSTMSGDFGEILTYLYLAGKTLPDGVRGATKWRLKQDRTKPAPHSDVVLLVLPTWPIHSDRDYIICAEVKAKATDGDSTPILSAIMGAKEDRTSRLAKTLLWLRDRSFRHSD